MMTMPKPIAQAILALLRRDAKLNWAEWNVAGAIERTLQAIIDAPDPPASDTKESGT